MDLEKGTLPTDKGTPEVKDTNNNEELSPSIKDPGTGNDDNARPEKNGDTDEEKAQLIARLAELEKRVSGQTRSWQEERQARTAIEKRIENWKNAGLDPDEIDRAIAATSTALQQSNPNAPQNQGALANLPKDIVTQEQFQTAMILHKWEAQKEAYFDANPEFDTPEFKTFFDATAATVTRKEMDEYGRIISTPKEVRLKAEKAMQKLLNIAGKSVAKKLTETREKVSGQTVTDTKHVKTKTEPAAEEKPETPEQWAAKQRERQRRLRGLT